MDQGKINFTIFEYLWNNYFWLGKEGKEDSKEIFFERCFENYSLEGNTAEAERIEESLLRETKAMKEAVQAGKCKVHWRTIERRARSEAALQRKWRWWKMQPDQGVKSLKLSNVETGLHPAGKTQADFWEWKQHSNKDLIGIVLTSWWAWQIGRRKRSSWEHQGEGNCTH